MRLPRGENHISTSTLESEITSDSEMDPRNEDTPSMLQKLERSVRSTSLDPPGTTPPTGMKDTKTQRGARGNGRNPKDPLDLVMAKRKKKEFADPVMAEAILTASKLPPPRILDSDDKDLVPEEIKQLITHGFDRHREDDGDLDFFRNYPVHLPRKPVIPKIMDYPTKPRSVFHERFIKPLFQRRDSDDEEEDEIKLVDQREMTTARVHTDEDWFMESVLHALCILLIILTLPLSLVFCLKVVAHYERAVLFRLGRLVSATAQGPGLIIVLPCLDRYRILDLRTFTFDVPTQEVLTKDSVTVVVNAVVYYRVRDPVRAVVNVEDANRATRVLGQTTLRNVLGTVNLDQLLTAREDIAALMQECLDSVTEAWGVKVERVEIKDVRLPIQLQRAMAAEAESVREATAKVIAAEGEMRASGALKAAASEIGQHPIAMQLRFLQAINSISSGKESTIIFPVPLEILSFLRLTHEQAGVKTFSQNPPAQTRGDVFSVQKDSLIGDNEDLFFSDQFEPSQIV